MAPLSSETSTPEAGRLDHIDGLRGLAALAVTWFHVTNGYPTDSPVRLSGHYGWAGVEAFFVISGFILPWAMYRAGYEIRHDFGRFIAKRLMRLEPPYLLSIVCVVILAYLSALAPGFRGSLPDYGVAQLASHVGYLTGIVGLDWVNVVYWTLAIEFQFYVLIALTFPFWLRCSSAAFLVATVVIGGIGFLLDASAFVVHFWALFALGIAVFRHACRLDTWRWTIFTGVVCAALLIAGHGAAVSIAAVLSAALIHQAPKVLKSRAFVWLGSISFSLYLIHVPVGGRVVNLLMRLGESEPLRLAVSSMALMVAVGTAWVFWRFVEHPATLWAARVKLGHRGRSTPDRAAALEQPGKAGA